ncbi:TPA: GIY-YIG nuclease family protein [Legionella pneumophila]|nr:GIY-YIG nuclease family protein [Legionella pneumophila]
MSDISYWVYMLLCDNNRYYTGYTNNLERRYLSHVEGTGGCKYTRSFKPIKIAQSWEIKEGKAKAMQIERYIKKLSRADKDKLVMDPHLLEAFLLDRAPCRQESI